VIHSDDQGNPLFADTAGAAELLNVRPGLIRLWKHRGLLTPVADDGHPVYSAADLWAVERVTREAATRHGGRPRLAYAPDRY
jgi:hypothetical protein